MLQKALLDNKGFRARGINVLDGFQGGELLVEVNRTLFTYDFTFAVSDAHSGTILVTGKVTAIDGPHAREGIAKNLVRELEKARVVQQAPANLPEAPSLQF